MAFWDNWSLGDLKSKVMGWVGDISAGATEMWNKIEDAVARIMAFLGTPQQNFYVTWDWFETICITDGLSVIAKDYEAKALGSKSGTLQADNRFNKQVWRLDSSDVKLSMKESNFCSTNPWTCILPGIAHWQVAGVTADETDGFFDTDIKDAQGLESLPKWDGQLSNILLNTRFIWQCYLDSDTVAEFISKVAEGVRDACGGYWDLKLVESPYDPSRLQVVDLKAVEDANTTGAPELDLGSIKSVARSWGVDTDIDDNLKHSIMMGANAKNNTIQNTHEPTKVWKIYAQKVEDRLYKDISPQLKCAEESKKDKNSDQCSKSEGEISDPVTEFKNSLKDLIDNVDDESIDSATVAMKTVHNDKGQNGEEDSGFIPTIPIGFKASFDGLGAFRWGQSFTVKQITDAGLLPKGYRFSITQVSQNISRTDWTTGTGGRVHMQAGGSNALNVMH